MLQILNNQAVRRVSLPIHPAGIPHIATPHISRWEIRKNEHSGSLRKYPIAIYLPYPGAPIEPPPTESQPPMAELKTLRIE